MCIRDRYDGDMLVCALFNVSFYPLPALSLTQPPTATTKIWNHQPPLSVIILITSMYMLYSRLPKEKLHCLPSITPPIQYELLIEDRNVLAGLRL